MKTKSITLPYYSEKFQKVRRTKCLRVVSRVDKYSIMEYWVSKSCLYEYNSILVHPSPNGLLDIVNGLIEPYSKKDLLEISKTISDTYILQRKGKKRYEKIDRRLRNTYFPPFKR